MINEFIYNNVKNDFFFVFFVSDVLDNFFLYLLGDIFFNFVNFNICFFCEMGYESFEYEIFEIGDYILGFGVVNVIIDIDYFGFLVDNVKVIFFVLVLEFNIIFGFFVSVFFGVFFFLKKCKSK